MTGAVVTGAVLTGAVLTGAVVTGAVVTGAVVTGAVVTGAVVTGAVVTGAVLTGSDRRRQRDAGRPRLNRGLTGRTGSLHSPQRRQSPGRHRVSAATWRSSTPASS